MVKTPLSLYFHIPFCTKKCPYCHFYVVPNKKSHQLMLLEAFFLELALLKPKIELHEIVSIYFGGGTPSLFGIEAITSLVSKIKAEAILSKDCEITIEVNPEGVTSDLMQGLKAAGINRVSIGVQSLQDASLLTLERTHSSKKAIEAIFLTAMAGIHNISIDVLFELPNQTIQSFQKTLELLDSLPITHLSLYNLSIEPNTAFSKRKLLLPSPEEGVHMLETAILHLEKMGLYRYEISAFAKDGFQSLHNIGYWTARPFLGLGPSAFSYYEGKRFRNVANLHRYVKALKDYHSPIDFSEKLPYPDNIHELFVLQLRLLKGANAKMFDLPSYTHQTLKKLVQEEYLLQEGPHYRLSQKGLLFYDTIASYII